MAASPSPMGSSSETAGGPPNPVMAIVPPSPMGPNMLAIPNRLEEGDQKCAIDPHDIPDEGCYRKVVSHVFGRNKACTSQIPDSCCVIYCRRHYQRFRYTQGPNWVFAQIKLVREQLDKMETWGGVKGWTIDLQAAKKKEIEQEDAELAQRATLSGNSAPAQNGSGCRERYLTSFLGDGKSFGDVRGVLRLIESDLMSRPKPQREFPAIQFLPSIDIHQYPPKTQQAKPAKEVVNASTFVLFMALDPSSVTIVKQWIKEKEEYEQREKEERVLQRSEELARRQKEEEQGTVLADPKENPPGKPHDCTPSHQSTEYPFLRRQRTR